MSALPNAGLVFKCCKASFKNALLSINVREGGRGAATPFRQLIEVGPNASKSGKFAPALFFPLHVHMNVTVYWPVYTCNF